jgi:hypothetical protein
LTVDIATAQDPEGRTKVLDLEPNSRADALKKRRSVE